MRVRSLNDGGIREFGNFVDSLRSGVEIDCPAYLLTSDEYSHEISIHLDVDPQQHFKSRYEIGTYLVAVFGDEDMQQFIGDIGFWSWFALLWFENLCPKKNGKRKPSKPYNYILSRNYNHRPRHSIFMTWQLVNKYAGDVEFMLGKDPAIRGELTEQLMARQEILSCDAAVRLASALYFDPEARSFKRGATGRKSAGCVYRYIGWLQQVQLTFDIHSVTHEELAELLPKEFDRFRMSPLGETAS